jgi:type I restriction enzyme, R subunit
VAYGDAKMSSTSSSDAYLTAEARARVEIDRQLEAAGWVVQMAGEVTLGAGPGVAVREFVLEKPHGRADYLLFVDRKPVGAIEAKPMGTTLTEVELQSAKYSEGLPDEISAPVVRLPFIYESTGAETRFTNLKDPEPRSRRVFCFHRPETLRGWIRDIVERPEAATLRARLRAMPPLEEGRLWEVQATAIRNIEESLHDDRPRALVQMATGSGKTFTAANLSYRLVRHADARRILFLVDRGNLGKQTHTVPSIQAWMVALRSELMDAEILAPSGGFLKMTKAHVFDSPSSAAGVLLGRSANGRIEWKDSGGRTLKELQEAQLDGT